MKYELTNSIVLSEVVIDNDNYSVDIELYIHPTDNVAPDFTKTITVESHNKQTGYQVDEQRNKAINSYINEINK